MGEIEEAVKARIGGLLASRSGLVDDGDYQPSKVSPLKRMEITPEQMRRERKEARTQRKQTRVVREEEESDEDEFETAPMSKQAKVSRMMEGIFDPEEGEKRVLKDKKDFLKGTIAEILERNSKEALLLIWSMVTGEVDDKLRAELARDWLTMAGHGKVERIELDITKVSDKELKRLRDDAEKSKELQDRGPKQLALTGDGEQPENA